ncbi:MAG: sulfatase-like hydrolase/transferase [Kofleriaceae bacterium]|nr:sulfatase-like hydrolase/transferase [Kofleriaceae bacterium]MBP9165951.1 sulfatase-like hydrolase/transferase [Kofleriaceae bacterium]MBP9857610.1 sulfatase-like hydrolase/transferase [Kofleriaceae bacterium]
MSAPPDPASPGRARRALAWLAPSLVAAGWAVGAAAIHDGVTHVDGAARVAVAAGFGFALGAPLALALAVLVRATLAAWQPRALLARLTDPDGAAPRLLGWLIAIALALAAVALAANQTVIGLARATAWKPRTIAVLLPIAMVAATAAIAALTVPAARGLGLGLTALADRRRRRGRPPRLTARVVVVIVGVGLALAMGAAYLGFVRPLTRRFALDGGGFLAIAVVGLAAMHLAWRHLPRRPLYAGAVALTVALGGAAVWARASQPALLLGLWGGDGFAGVAIDVLVDVRAVRAAVPAAALRPTPRPGAPRRDLIVLTIDTFRPDRLAVYGGPVAAPGLAALARRGTVFERALAPGNVTRRSLPALATGVAAPRVRGRVAGWALRLDPRHLTVAERLRAGGYDTLGLFCCDGFWSTTRPTGLEAGFTDVVIERDATRLVAALRARLAARGPDAPPLYVWMHWIELHEWAGGDPDMRPEKRRLYDETLARVDGAVVALEEALTAAAPGRTPIVMVTGDHSEALGDHGQPFHSTDLYNSQLAVPLIVAGPGIATGRVPEVVSLLDLPPTLLELAGFEPLGHPSFDGRSLADVLTGARAADIDRGRAYAAMVVDRHNRVAGATLVVGRWKLVRLGDRPDELYDVIADPHERVDRARLEPEVLRALQAELAAQRLRDRASPFAR